MIGTVRPADARGLGDSRTYQKEISYWISISWIGQPCNASSRSIGRRRGADLAARASSSQLHVDPVLTAEYNGIAVVHLLEIIRATIPRSGSARPRVVRCSATPIGRPQDEGTPFRPRNPYRCGQTLRSLDDGRTIARSHGLFACSAILFNHESPRRGHEFVTRKVSWAAAMIRAGRQSELELGDLDARRDWGFAATTFTPCG